MLGWGIPVGWSGKTQPNLLIIVRAKVPKSTSFGTSSEDLSFD